MLESFIDKPDENSSKTIDNIGMSFQREYYKINFKREIDFCCL